jgi:hypothetical protein
LDARGIVRDYTEEGGGSAPAIPMSYNALDTRGIVRDFKRGVLSIAISQGRYNSSSPCHIRGIVRDYTEEGRWFNFSLPVLYHALDARGIVRDWTEEGDGSTSVYPCHIMSWVPGV